MRETLITNKNKCVLSTQVQSNLETTELSLTNILKSTDISVSVEICPNRHLDGHVLSRTTYSFYSVTWFSPTVEQLEDVEEIPAIVLAKQLQFQGYNVLLHIAGRNLKRYQVLKILEIVKKAGITNIFALQGDPSQVVEKNDKLCDFPYAADLVKFIRSCYGNFFTIGVAGYPEKHPSSENMTTDLEYLKHKVSCGADFIITQAAFDYATFSNFVKQCRSLDIHIPIIPGIFVISSHRTLKAMSNFCGVPVPKNIQDVVDANRNNDAAVREFGVHQASGVMNRILEGGQLFGGMHVFSLNNLELLEEVLRRVGVNLTIEKPLPISGEPQK